MKNGALAMAVACLISLTMSSCNNQTKQTNASSPTMVKEVQDTVTGMAGGAAFKAGKKAEKRIGNINQQHNQDLEKALAE